MLLNVFAQFIRAECRYNPLLYSINSTNQIEIKCVYEQSMHSYFAHERYTSIFQASFIMIFLPHDRLSLNSEKAHKDQFLLLDNEEARAVKIIFLSLSCQLSMTYSLRFSLGLQDLHS